MGGPVMAGEYLDDSGNPIAAPAAASAPVYLDESGNPKGQSAPSQPQSFYQASGLKGLVDSAKQTWAAGQAQRDAEAKVVKDSIDAVKRGDYGTAAETLLSHIASGAANITKQQFSQGGDTLVNAAKEAAGNVKANLTELDPQHGKMYARPVTPIPGVGAAAGDFADEAAAAPASAPAEAVASKPGLLQRVKQAISPNAATQAKAQPALRTAAESAASDAGVMTGDTSGSIRTLLDEPIEKASVVERELYDSLNKASGTDLKDLYEEREALQDAIEDPTMIGQKTLLRNHLGEIQQRIDVGEANVRAKLGTDAPGMMKQAIGATQQRYSMEDVAKKVFNNESVVKGNIEHGASESVNVDSAIRQVENLDKPSRYAPRGTPTRLEQALGEQGAKSLKDGLYEAQAAGKKVLDRNWFIGKIAGTTAVGGTLLGEILKR